MKQAIIYTRFSPRPKPDETMSCEFQEEKCREYCELHGLDVLAIYRDKALSGKNDKNRPGLQEAIQHVCDVQGVLVVYNMARLSRSIKFLVELSELLDKKQTDLVFVTQNIDTTTPYGRFYFHILAAVGQMQREETSNVTKDILLNMQKNGLRISRRPPYGFALDPNDKSKIISDKHEQGVLDLILRYHKQGLGLSAIITELNRIGLKPRAKMWYPGTIKRIIEKHLPKNRK